MAGRHSRSVRTEGHTTAWSAGPWGFGIECYGSIDIRIGMLELISTNYVEVTGTAPPLLARTYQSRPFLGAAEWGEVHVWTVQLSSVPHLPQLLSDYEFERASSFISAEAAGAFVASRIALRCVLGQYALKPPQDIPLVQRCTECQGAHGALEPLRLSRGRLRISTSRSSQFAALAIGLGREIGVDIECERVDIPWRDVAPIAFSTALNRMLRGVNPIVRSRAYLEAWTRKEALHKRLGEGLAGPVREIGTLADQEQGDREAFFSREERTSAGVFYRIHSPPGYAGSLVTSAVPSRVREFRIVGWSDQET